MSIRGCGDGDPVVKSEPSSRVGTFLRLAMAACILPTLVSCGEASDGDLGGVTLTELESAIDRGVDCPDLFKIRNEIDPKTEDFEAAAPLLRDVGCFSSSSSRNR